MFYQNPDSQDIFLVVILFVAVFVFVIMLIATYAVLRSQAKAKNEIGSKDEVKPSLPVAVLDILPEDRPLKEDVPKAELKSSSLAGIFARLWSGVVHICRITRITLSDYLIMEQQSSRLR